MIELPAIVRNAAGIHCRPSAEIIKEVMGYPGNVRIASQSRESDLRSVMSLLALGLQQGTNILIRVTGPDEEAMCRKLVTLFETHFDFPPRAEGEPPVPLESLEPSATPRQTPT